MAFPLRLSLRLAGYLAWNRLARRRRFPLVLMLEPTFQCNLACAGCGRIREYSHILDRRLSPEECLGAVAESGAPVVAITGGEPLVHPDIGPIVADIARARRFVILCTNGLLLRDSLSRFRPGPYMSFGVHLDGLAATHDGIAGRPGVFQRALEGIQAAKAAGFRVYTNTTIYKGTDIPEINELFRLLARLGVDGIMVSPAFNYQEVAQDLFLSREDVAGLFQPIYELRREIPFYNTPLYLEFLAGRRELPCTPWGNPTRNPMGWKQPCYLITDGHFSSFAELMEKTPWERYGPGRDPRCTRCMVHCGFEPSAVLRAMGNVRDLWQMVRWNLSRANSRGKGIEGDDRFPGSR